MDFVCNVKANKVAGFKDLFKYYKTNEIKVVNSSVELQTNGSEQQRDEVFGERK